MNWLNDLEIVKLLHVVLVSVDDRWDSADMRLDVITIPILLCGFSMVSYCMDIYQLVKRTSMTETMTGMLLPVMAAHFGAVWLTEYGSLPAGDVLDGLVEQPFSLALSVQITACALLFAIIFALTRMCWRGGGGGSREAIEQRKTEAQKAEIKKIEIKKVEIKKAETQKAEIKKTGNKNREAGTEKEEWRWIATYTMDFLTAFTAFVTGCYGMFTNLILHQGRNLFEGCSVLYGIFLYLLPLLLFKTVLLLLLLLLRVYSAQITAFPYRQGRNAGRYLYRWLLLYRCPLLREVLVFCLVAGMLLTKAAEGTVREDALMSAVILGILVVGYLWTAVRRSTLPLKKFRRWGATDILRNSYSPRGGKAAETVQYLKEQFCREYFCEEPLFRDKEYTLTRNFLVDEREYTGIYYLGALRCLPRGWIHDGRRWMRVITFGDGSRIVLEKGKQNDGEIFRGIERYAGSYGLAEGQAIEGGVTNPQKAYTDTIKGQILAVWTVVMIFALTVVLMDGLGVW